MESIHGAVQKLFLALVLDGTVLRALFKDNFDATSLPNGLS
jgi:hypothetical protein